MGFLRIASLLCLLGAGCRHRYEVLMLEDAKREKGCAVTVVINDGRGRRCHFSRETAAALEKGGGDQACPKLAAGQPR